MSNPSAAQVQSKYNDYDSKHKLQSEMKDAFNKAQKQTGKMFEPVKQLVVDIWDEVEFFFRHEKPESSKRRKCREWGVVYISRTRTKITGTVTDEATGEALNFVSVKILETKTSTSTNEEGNYKLLTTFAGTATLEFSLGGYVSAMLKVEISGGQNFVQDIKMTKV